LTLNFLPLTLLFISLLAAIKGFVVVDVGSVCWDVVVDVGRVCWDVVVDVGSVFVGIGSQKLLLLLGNIETLWYCKLKSCAYFISKW